MLLGMFVVFMALGLKSAIIFLNETLEEQEGRKCQQHRWETTKTGALICIVCSKRPSDDVANKEDFEIEE